MQNPMFFCLSVVLILCTPGPTNTLLATSAASLGLRQSLRLVPAESLGYLIAILSWGLIVGPTIVRIPAIDIILRVSLGSYIMVTAMHLRKSIANQKHGEYLTISPSKVFITTVANPKAMLIAFVVMPFGTPYAWCYVVGFQCLTALIALGWIGVGAGLGGAARAFGSSKVVPRIGALFLFVFGLTLTVSPLMRL